MGGRNRRSDEAIIGGDGGMKEREVKEPDG